MNKDNLGQCRTCGELISKNLGITESSYGSSGQGPIRFNTSSSGNCPHCGEADPHLTDEEVERRERIKWEQYEEGIKESNREAWGCFIAVGIVLLLGLIAFLIANGWI